MELAKVDTPASIWNELIDKELTDVDIEEYAERLKKARTVNKSKKNDRSAKIITVENKNEINEDEDKDAEDKKVETVKKKRDTSRDEAATKIGAFVFFGVFGVIQIWLLIDWIIKGHLLDTLVLHLLPTIIAGGLFIVTSIIDVINNRKKKREEAKKAEAISKYNRSTKKKGGKHK